MHCLFSILDTLSNYTWVELPELLWYVRSASYTVSMIQQIMKARAQGNPEDIMSLLERFHDRCATDSRDKIYSLLGIAAPYPNSVLTVDYTIRWQDVFRNTTRYIIEGSQTLDILGWGSTEGLDLPSWVPDFAN